MEENATRINKFLSESGYCSRREADKLIDQGRVTINGIVPEMGTKITSKDEIRVDGELPERTTDRRRRLVCREGRGCAFLLW